MMIQIHLPQDTFYHFNPILFLSLLILLPFSSDFFTSSLSIITFFYPSWAISFKTMTDIETLAIGIAVAYPIALYLIGIALWAVLIGVISITSSNKHFSKN